MVFRGLPVSSARVPTLCVDSPVKDSVQFQSQEGSVDHPRQWSATKPVWCLPAPEVLREYAARLQRSQARGVSGQSSQGVTEQHRRSTEEYSAASSRDNAVGLPSCRHWLVAPLHRTIIETVALAYSRHCFVPSKEASE